MRVHGLGFARLVLVALWVSATGLVLSAVPAGAVSLPDGRVYELVSPVTLGQDANVFVPAPSAVNIDVEGVNGIESRRPFEVASDGDTVAYVGEPPPTGGDGAYEVGNGNEFLAKRNPGGGWSSSDIQLPGHVVRYEDFSSDLSVGIFTSEESLLAESPESNYLARVNAGAGEGEIQPFYKGTPSRNLRHISYSGLAGGVFYAGGNSGTSGVAEFSHRLFETNAALTSTAVDGGENENNLYDSVDGRLYSVNVLPDGKAQPNAVFGSFPTYNSNGISPPGLSHVISAGGSRVFWTALETVEIEERQRYLPKALYVREDDSSPGAKTVQVDAAVGGGGVFRTASTDGSKVFFTKGDLYRFDVDSGQTLDLTPGVNVKGVVGASDDGEYVYYADASDKVYLWHGGASTPIATLSPQDSPEESSEASANGGVQPFGDGTTGISGAWVAAVGFHTAQVTPDGQNLIFMAKESLTGYDNEINGEALFEVYLYEAGTGHLRCVSCDPTGKPPVSTNIRGTELGGEIGAYLPISQHATYQPQVISPDGGRVFFESAEPLVPQDTNGWVDVYEWERDGAGSCSESQGCVYLLSEGTGPGNSYLIGSSVSGSDVFFVTRGQFVALDRNDNDDVYDARVGGVQPSPSPACSGSGCQGVPPAPPIFATPSSVTFDGVGNFSAGPAVRTKLRARAPSKAQKLAKALKACRAKGSVRKRNVCEASARRRYGSKSRTAKSTAKSNRGSK